MRLCDPAIWLQPAIWDKIGLHWAINVKHEPAAANVNIKKICTLHVFSVEWMGRWLCVSAGWQRSPAAQRLPGEAPRRLASQQRAAGKETAGQRTAWTPQHQVRTQEVLCEDVQLRFKANHLVKVLTRGNNVFGNKFGNGVSSYMNVVFLFLIQQHETSCFLELPEQNQWWFVPGEEMFTQSLLNCNKMYAVLSETF